MIFAILLLFAFTQADIGLRIANGNYDKSAIDVAVDGEVLFQDVAPLDQPGAITQYTQIDMPRGNVTVRVTKAGDSDVVLGEKSFADGFIDGVFHTLLVARRDDTFCASVQRDTGAAAPVSIPEADKTVVIVYNVACASEELSVNVLLNDQPIWPDVEQMSRGEPRQFTAGVYPVEVVQDESRVLAMANGGVPRRFRFQDRHIYRLFLSRIGSTTPNATLDIFANGTIPLPDDLELDTPSEVATVGARIAAWFVNNTVVAGVIIGVVLLCCCICVGLIVLGTRRRRRRSRDYEW